MERVCVYPGSFDPLTVGHADLIRRCAAQFDRVIVAVLHNPWKKGCFPVETRIDFLRKTCAGLPNVEVDAWDGLLVDYLRKTGAQVVIRGLRGAADLDGELRMAQINQELLPGMETLFMATRPEHGHISSTVVRELLIFGSEIAPYVPDGMGGVITEEYRRLHQ